MVNFVKDLSIACGQMLYSDLKFEICSRSMQPEDPASYNWVGSWDFYQEIDKGYDARYGGTLVEQYLGHWIFLPNQTLVQWKTEINYYVVDPSTGQSSLLGSELGIPILALWSTDYNTYRPQIGYYNLMVATSLLSGTGLNFDLETGQGSYNIAAPDIKWEVGVYYEFNDLNQVTVKKDPEDLYESPGVFSRKGSPESWNSEFYESELHFGVDLNQDGFIGNSAVNPVDPVNPVPVDPECSDSTDVFRFYNPGTGVHFFTPSSAEKDDIISKPEWGYKYEGVAYKAPTDTGTELYRFYNRDKGYHFLTASKAEADSLTGMPEWGYKYEGRSYKVTQQATSETPNEVHRFYNPGKGIHFYSASDAEANNVIANSLGSGFDLSNAQKEDDLLPGGWGYIYEGTAWYVTDC